jgi:hypothetical protein
MTWLKFYVSWCGEKSAGINPSSEEILIQFKYGQPIDSDVIEYWTDSLKDFYDGANVELMSSSHPRSS